MAVEGGGEQLVKVVALLGAAVVMVPLFRRLGLGSVLGYLSAGLLIGPFGLAGSPTRRRSCTWPSWAWSCSCS
jgi:Kef-type K+ transport systems, membrane components